MRPFHVRHGLGFAIQPAMGETPHHHLVFYFSLSVGDADGSRRLEAAALNKEVQPPHHRARMKAKVYPLVHPFAGQMKTKHTTGGAGYRGSTQPDISFIHVPQCELRTRSWCRLSGPQERRRSTKNAWLVCVFASGIHSLSGVCKPVRYWRPNEARRLTLYHSLAALLNSSSDASAGEYLDVVYPRLWDRSPFTGKGFKTEEEEKEEDG